MEPFFFGVVIVEVEQNFLHQLAGEEIMAEFSFLGKLFGSFCDDVYIILNLRTFIDSKHFSIFSESIVIFLGTIRTMRMRRRSPTCEFLSVL